MVYCDYVSYTEAGGTMSCEQFAIWSKRASRLIDRLTYGRASRYAEALSSELADACAQIADILLEQSGAEKAAVRGVSSASNDGYSESYFDTGTVAKSASRACRRILEDALGNDPYNLLYAGVM